jgi:hypothetical protein
VTAIRNIREERIEVGFIVTVVDREHEWGTGHVEHLERFEKVVMARVVLGDGSGVEWFNVDELTNVNVAMREKALEGP